MRTTRPLPAVTSLRSDGYNCHLITEELGSDLDAHVKATARGAGGAPAPSGKKRARSADSDDHAAVMPTRADMHGHVKQKKRRGAMKVCDENITLQGDVEHAFDSDACCWCLLLFPVTLLQYFKKCSQVCVVLLQ
jgi:hypothetical protein